MHDRLLVRLCNVGSNHVSTHQKILSKSYTSQVKVEPHLEESVELQPIWKIPKRWQRN